MSGFDWNGNGREDAGDWYTDYEIMNLIDDETESGSSRSYSKLNVYAEPKKKRKRPLTEEELERNGEFLRKFFIVIGLIFSFAVLENNIGWLLFLPQYASWPGIIISVIVLVAIVKNILHHRRKGK